MEVYRFTLDEEHAQRLQADMEGSHAGSFQDYICFKLFGEAFQPVAEGLFTPEEAVRRARTRLVTGQYFTLPELYTEEEWALLPSPKVAGVFGRRFFKYIQSRDDTGIRFVEGRKRNRQTLYRLILEGEEIV